MRVGQAIVMGLMMVFWGGGRSATAEPAPAPLTLTCEGQPACSINRSRNLHGQ